jgi:WD40 repeat protein/energy-coupling factor transporter ATP-binding protein EcfA2
MSRDALVVGINTYQYLPSLQAPARDAEAIAQQLHTYGEFRVHRLPEVIQNGKPQIGQTTQVTLRDLEIALINLFKPKGGTVPHTAVFYFSGHGIQRDAGIREGYLALSDSHPDRGFYGLSLFWLRRLLQESPVRQRIIWLDCCHSGELLNFLEADPGAHPGTDRLFMAASREYEEAYESLNSPYSVFTQAVLSGLDPNRVESGIVTNHSLTDWVNHTLKGEIQQPLFESSGSEIILTRSNGTPIAPKTVQSKDICPYRGLECFDEAHAEYFYGREDLTAQLVERLKMERFIAVVGASGSGKSSLVRAGLMAQLRQGHKLPGSDRWRIKLLTPTEHPLKSLAAAFIDPDSSNLERAEQLRRAEVFLQDGATGLAQLVRASLPIASGATGASSECRPHLLLVIDQFEEVFTLSQGIQAEQERRQFFNCLMGAIQVAGDYLSVVVVLRADFLSKCSLYDGLAQQVEQHLVMVAPLKYEQIKSTIVRPAQKVGLVCEPNLVYTMLLDVIGAPGELPLLQYTLLELWQQRRTSLEGGVARLTLDTYRELGGVRGTLQKRATEVFYSLTADEQAVAKRIFLALTQLGEGTEDTRRRVVKSELVSPAFPIEVVERVLEKLIAAKLIVTSREKGNWCAIPDDQDSSLPDSLTSSQSATSSYLCQEVVDVAHEALIRNWPLLRDWLNQNREMLRRLRRIEQASQEWDATGQPSTGEYLLHGLRLRDAEDFLQSYPQELSALAQQHIAVSHEEIRRVRRESRQLQIAVPSVLLTTLAVLLSQYHGAVQTQAEQDYQLQVATSRERAAIAQSILQDGDGDPMAALLISRLAAEKGGLSYEAQSSLRAALQDLRLQLELPGQTGAIHQLAFSPDHQHIAAAGANGIIRLWSLNPQTIYNVSLQPSQVLAWSDQKSDQTKADIVSMAFSSTGKQIAAIAQNSSQVKIWSVASGNVALQLSGSAVVTHIAFSPEGNWIATVQADRTISIWKAETGELQAHVPQANTVSDIQFSPDGRKLLITEADGGAQLWQVITDRSQTVKLEPAANLSHPGGVNQAIFSPSGRWIATACQDGRARLWDVTTGQLRQTLPQIPQPDPKLQPPDPSKQVDAESQPTDQDNQSNASQLPSSPVPSSPLVSNLQPLMQVQFSPNEEILATVDNAQRVKLWNVHAGALQTELATSSSPERQPNSSWNVDTAHSISFSPDGRLLILPLSHQTKSDGHYTTYLWDVQTGKQVGFLPGHSGAVTAAQFSWDGTYVATASTDGTVRLWATESGGELPTLRLPDAPVQSAMFMQNTLGSQIGQRPGTTRLSAQTTADAASQPLSVGDRSLTWFTPGLIASHSTDQQPWQLLQLNRTHSAESDSGVIAASSAAHTAPEALSMVTIASDGRLQHWQILTDQAPAAMPMVNQMPRSPLPDHQLTTAHWAAIKSQSLWRRVLNFLGNRSSSRSLASESAALSSGSSDAVHPSAPVEPASSQALASPDIAPSQVLQPSWMAPSNAQAIALSSVALSPDGQFSATANIEGELDIHQRQADQSMKLVQRIRNWRMVANKNEPLSETIPVSMSDRDRDADVSATDAAQPIRSEDGDPVAIRQLTFSPNGRQLLGIADDLTVRLWDVQSGQLLHVLQGHTATVQQARFSSDGEWIVTASWDRTARLWRVASGAATKTLSHQDAVSSASFSPDGQRVVTTSWDGKTRIWNVATGEQQLLLAGHEDAVLDAQFSPDGRSLVTASADGSVRLWDTRTGVEQIQLHPNSQGGASEPIVQAFFSPDGQYVAGLAKSGQVYLWAATWDMLLKIARDRSLRQLTPEECSRYLRLSPQECPKLPLSEGT